MNEYDMIVTSNYEIELSDWLVISRTPKNMKYSQYRGWVSVLNKSPC